MLRRILTYASESGDIPVPITIDTPRQGERDWSCAYEIGWPDGPRRGFGIDASLQIQNGPRVRGSTERLAKLLQAFQP